MSVPVELSAVRDRIAEYGTVAYLVTVGDEGGPTWCRSRCRVDGDRLVVPTGRTSRRNLEANPALTLLWPPRPDPTYSMLVDGGRHLVLRRAGRGDGRAALGGAAPRRRGATGDGPTCRVAAGASRPQPAEPRIARPGCGAAHGWERISAHVRRTG